MMTPPQIQNAGIDPGSDLTLFGGPLADAPVVWSDDIRCWIVSGYQEVQTCLDHDGIWLSSAFYEFLQSTFPKSLHARFSELLELPANLLTIQDDPYHGHAKKAVTGAFNRSVRLVAADIETDIDETVAALPNEFDFVASVAAPLANRSICRTIGISEQKTDAVIAAATDILDFLGFDPKATAKDMLARADAAKTSLAFLTSLLEQMIIDAEAAPGQNLVSELVHNRKPSEPWLSPPEIAYQVLTLLIAGFITTTHVLSAGAYRLLSDGPGFGALHDDQKNLRRCVDAMLRMDGPTVFVMRRARTGFSLGGQHIKDRDTLLLHLRAANHDSKKFNPCPIGQGDNDADHLAFGKGMHYCTGVPLARLVLLKSIEALARHCPDAQIRDPAAVTPFSQIPAISGIAKMPLVQ